MAVTHYQFEAIHPFTDGNGRTGRVLNSLFLIQGKSADVADSVFEPLHHSEQSGLLSLAAASDTRTGLGAVDTVFVEGC